ncbi:hypothetical protein CEN39_15590 [Fischerella thermalis CCMEE 5201]|jgi:hypothetical protein|nr:hypothetical protein CEN39_15590 [Fischerella thermalis CCMEE 5201]
MKSQRVKILLSLTILTTLSLLTLVVLFNKDLTAITKQPQEAVKDTQSWQGLQVSQQPSESKTVVYIKDFGAIGDGIQNDTSAIQKAIDDVYNAGRGVVIFPSGTYKVTINPNTAQAITIRPKVTLQGTSNKKSVIKLADRQGNYNSILAGERPDSDLSDFAMYDLAIDGNGSNNPVNTESDLNTHKMRYALRIYIGSRIRIERCSFTNQNNTNTISLNGEISDVVINNNLFELIGGGNVDYDHSTIYTHNHTRGKQIEIVKNSFSSRNGAGTNGARTAIEIHGDEHIVKDNIITGFTNGINVTGYSKSGSSNNLIITGNVIKAAYTGITIWSYFSPGNTTNPAISNSTIANNTISLNIDGWRSLWGDTSSAGIGLEPNSDAPIKNLSILNNEISVTNFSGNGSARDNLAGGIRLWRNAFPHVEIENLRIEGNKITNLLASGIYISQPINQGEISQNTIVNPGQSNGNFHDNYRTGIIIDGAFNNVNINKNFLIDTQTNNTMKWGILSSANCTGKCKIYENKIQINAKNNLKTFRQIDVRNNENFEISN